MSIHLENSPPRKSLPVYGLAEIVLEVKDLTIAENFYGNVLGFPLKFVEERRIVVEAPACRIHLQLPGTPGHRGAGPFHFAFSATTENLAEIAELLRERGVKVRGPVDLGEAISVFCFDPEGNEIEFTDYFARPLTDSTCAEVKS